MSTTEKSPLVSCTWLNSNLDAEQLILLDASFFLARQKRDASAEYHQAHIPHAQFFDIDKIADLNSPLPHTLPSANDFAIAVGLLGVDEHSHVIVYDNNGFFAAARVWWMFRVFGHAHVQVLDGGFRRWKQLGYTLQTDLLVIQKKQFISTYHAQLVYNLPAMQMTLNNQSRQILDARSPDSFKGERPLTTTDLQAGHIPGSLNIYYADLYDKNEFTLHSPEHLRSLFKTAGIDLTQALVTSCGSGVSAAVLALALFRIGIIDVPVYDGSWAEWGRSCKTKKQLGSNTT